MDPPGHASGSGVLRHVAQAGDVVPVAGLVILFLSVLRQRMRVAKTDRYSKEVLR